MVARALEANGIATAVIGTMHAPLDHAPRGLVTPYRDSPIGPPLATDIHRVVVRQAFEMLRSQSEHGVERAEILSALNPT